jgi:hypothetical protein
MAVGPPAAILLSDDRRKDEPKVKVPRDTYAQNA